MAREAASPSCVCFVDAVHYAPHHLMDVRDIDADFLACCPYKFFGPHCGIIFGKESNDSSAEFNNDDANVS